MYDKSKYNCQSAAELVKELERRDKYKTDLAAGKQRIPLNRWQLGLGLSMLGLLFALGATSQRWLEAEQQENMPTDAEAES